MDPEHQRETLSRLEADYLRGALSAEEYARLRDQVLGGASEEEILFPTWAPEPAQARPPASVVALGADPVTGTRLASWGRRAAAWFVDVLVIAVAWALVFAWAFTTEDPDTGEISDGAAFGIFGVVFLAGPIYQWLMIGQWGQTLGKMALGIKVLRGEDAKRVGYARSLGRAGSVVLLGIFSLPLLLAYLWPLWDKRNQTLYDKMAGTIVVRI